MMREQLKELVELGKSLGKAEDRFHRSVNKHGRDFTRPSMVRAYTEWVCRRVDYLEGRESELSELEGIR